MGAVGTGTGTTYRPRRAKRLKPAGHSATIEALIQPAIVIASTLMSAIAAYVLAYDEISTLLADRGTWKDAFVVVLCVGMGFLIDMAIIVSATRYKMHAVRNDPREERWLTLAKWVLIIGLTSETLTLFYFFVSLNPAIYPSWLVWLASQIHAVLVTARAFLPPVVVAYFAAGVLPVSFDRADRNREIKTRTSSNVMTLIDRLSYVEDTDDKGEMLRALGGQLVLDTYATYDETGRTTEDEQLRRDGKLLAHMARMHNLDWNRLGADVAPELVTPTSHTGHAQTLPALPSVSANQRPLSRHEQRREQLARDMHGLSNGYPNGYRGHPTAPRGVGGAVIDDMELSEALDSLDDDLDDTWQQEDSRVLRSGRLPEMDYHGGKRERAQAARMAPLASELTVREFVLPDLPASKYEQADDSDHARAVLRVLEQDPRATRRQVMQRANVSDGTARRYIALWDERRSKRGKKKAAPRTQEMPAITENMVATALTTD